MKLQINIADLIQEGEGYLVEFKESPKNLEKEICAFANANGGTIYIGITDKGTKRNIELTNKLKSQLIAAAHNCDPPPNIEVHTINDIVALQIDESTNKPVRAPNGFYLRIGATSQKLTRDEILSFAVTETKLLFDNQLFVEETADECLSNRPVETFRHKARLDVELDNNRLLMNLGCLKMQNNRPYLTCAGLLLFGRNPQEFFSHATITILAMEDPSTIEEQKILRGTLFEQVENAFSFLKHHLRSKPRIETLRREDVLEFPEFALRELLVNAVIHRDYFERSADVTIKIFPSYIEFSNPGTASNKLPLKSLFGRSYRRNPMIADLFFHANYIERAGTGLLRVKQTLAKLNLPPMRLSEEGIFFIVTLPRKKLSGIERTLNERQQNILTLPDDAFPLSTEEYAKRFNISVRTARLDIRGLVEDGLLTPIKEKRHVRYKRGSMAI